MMKAHSILLFFLGLTTVLCGQTSYEIEGRVINSDTRQNIPFANIYNLSLNKGTISNTDGYFRISVAGPTDTLRVTYIGFKDQNISLKERPDFYVVELEENVVSLGEITVTPQDDSHLYELVNACKRSASKLEKESKAYYELKSFVGDDQVELVEGYYTVDLKGYKLAGLNLKAGRLALRPYKNRFFVSLESSRAILMLNLADRNIYFPINPLALSKSTLKKSYNLSLDYKYSEGDTDSIYVIDYLPKDTSGLFFKGKLWINTSKNLLVKITLNCDHALKHPFLPLFPNDNIAGVSFSITQTFKTVNSQALFNHTDFEYAVDYVSRIGEADERTYSVRSNAVLYAYDFDAAFFLPLFDFNDNDIGDYQKINAMPYNDFFWEFNDEYRLNDSLNTNETFFLDSVSVTNKSVFKSNPYIKKGLMEFPFVAWSPSRIKFREMVPDTSVMQTANSIPSQQYKLSVKIFADMNSYSDSTNFLTATIFDPYESFYYLPMDNKTHCFINIYFDLCEIKRQELARKLSTGNYSAAEVEEMYTSFLKEYEAENSAYLKAAQRGTNEAEMVKYNDYVFKKLGINNIEIFNPFGN